MHPLVRRVQQYLTLELWYFSLDPARYQETQEALDWLEVKENQVRVVSSPSSDLPKRIWLARNMVTDKNRLGDYVFPNIIQ